jgi:antitoxin component YwqK of YwqJK toxin-antitoxin module
MKNLFLITFLIFIGKTNFFLQIKNNYWYSIYNKDNLKVEISFDNTKGNCVNNTSVIYKYRFNGYLGGYNRYINWKIDYENCNGDIYTHGNGIQIGGINIINELGTGKLEDQIKEEFDDKISIKIFNSSLYGISTSKNKDYLNTKIYNNVYYKTFSKDDYYFDEGKRKFFHTNDNLLFSGRVKTDETDLFFSKGNLTESKKYHPNDQIKSRTEYFNNTLRDRMKYAWFENGQLSYKLNFIDDKVSDMRCWDENANEYTKEQCLNFYGLNETKGDIIKENESGVVTIENEKKLTVFEICKNIQFELKEDEKYKCFNKESGVFQGVGGCEIGSYLCGPYKVFQGNKLIVNENYTNGLQDGPQIIKDENGRLLSKTIYENNKITYMKFLMDSGDVYKEFDGPFFQEGSYIREYNLDDFNYFEQEFIGNNKSICRNFYKDKSLKEEFETNLLFSLKTGYYKAYYQNGKLKVSGNFSSDYFNQKIGDWKFYNSDGSIDEIEKFKIEEEKWANGDLKVLKLFYYDNQEKKWLKHGKWKFRDENGKITYKTFKFGELEGQENKRNLSFSSSSIVIGSFGNILNAEKQKKSIINEGFKNIDIKKVGSVYRVSILVLDNKDPEEVLKEVKKYHKSAWISIQK